jgi:hypothetical protein
MRGDSTAAAGRRGADAREVERCETKEQAHREIGSAGIDPAPRSAFKRLGRTED